MNMKIRSFLFFSCLFKYFSTFRFVPNFWSVVYTNQCRFKLLMFEEKTVSSCVKYRWVKSSDHERKCCVRNSGQQAREELKKTQCNMTGKKKKSLCVYFVMKKKKSQWPECKASSSKMKTTAFANDLQRKISQGKNNEHFQTSKPLVRGVTVCILQTCVKMKGKKKKGKK